MERRLSSGKPRIDFIDLFRAFGILCMIMGHIRFGASFDKWIHGFHMPMFFFISGWFYSNSGNGAFGARTLRKAKSLLLPYAVFAAVLWIGCLSFIPEYRNLDVLRYVLWENTYKISVGDEVFGISPLPGALWFLTAMFFLTRSILPWMSFARQNGRCRMC